MVYLSSSRRGMGCSLSSALRVFPVLRRLGSTPRRGGWGHWVETELGWVVDPGLTSSPCWSWALTSREALGGTGPGGWCPAWVELGSLGPCPHPGAVSPAVCRTAETRPPPSPFLCLDLTYVSSLLQELGFPGDKVLKVGILGCPLPAPQEHVPAFPTHVLLSPLVSSS